MWRARSPTRTKPASAFYGGGQLLLNEEPAGDLENEDDEDTETSEEEEEDQQVAPAASTREQLDRLVAMIVKFASMLEAPDIYLEAAVATALAERRTRSYWLLIRWRRRARCRLLGGVDPKSS